MTVQDVGSSGFQLTFSIDKQSPLQILFLLTGGAPLLFMRVVIVVTVNGTANVLIDGVITNNEIAPGDKGSNSTLTITGKDLTVLMDQSNWSGFPFPACPAEARVALLLAKYAIFGIIPLIIPSVLIDISVPIEQIPGQQGTDLKYIRSLAEEVGYVFYIDPGPAPGMTRAYWGPQIKVGAVQPALELGHGRLHQRGEPALQVRPGAEQHPARLHLQRGNAASASRSRSRRSRRSTRRSGLIPPLPTNIMADLKPFRDDLSKTADSPGHHDGAGRGRANTARP